MAIRQGEGNLLTPPQKGIWVASCSCYIISYTYSCIFIAIQSNANPQSSSSSCAATTYIPDYLSIPPYNPSLQVSFSNNILCPLRVVGDKFLLVGQHWLSHVWRSIEKHCFWVRLASQAVSRISCSSQLNGFRDRR